MLGKVILSIFLIGILFLGMMWLFADQSPTEFIKDLFSPSGNHISSSDVSKLEYRYTLKLGEPYNSTNDFSVEFRVVKETADTMCYTYKVTEVREGEPDLIHGFMKGFYNNVGEGAPICSPKNTEDESFMPIYPLVSSGTTLHGTKSGSDYSYTYDYRSGILKSFTMKYSVDTEKGTVPAEVTMKLVNTITRGQEASTTTPSSAATTTQTGSGEAHLSSMDVSWIKYRFLWEIPVKNSTTGDTTQTRYLDYTIRVDVVNRQGTKACVKYAIVSVAEGSQDDAVEYTNDILGYPQGSVQCVDLSQQPTPKGIPYFLFNPSFTAMDVRLNGSGVSGLFSVEKGVFYSLMLRIEDQAVNENGNASATIPVTLRVNILDMG
jgi:hypothetical protein